MHKKVKKNVVFYRLLRLEWLKANGVPLSSDVFTSFQKDDPSKKSHNGEVIQATKKLLNQVVPSFAIMLENKYKIANELDQLKLTQLMHQHGLNMRYLGYVRNQVVSKELRKKILSEIVARVIKHVLRERLRSRMRSESGMIAEKSCVDVVVDTFNMVLLDGAFSLSSNQGNKEKEASSSSRSYYEQYMGDYEDSIDCEELKDFKREEKEEMQPFWRSNLLKEMIEDSFPSSLSDNEKESFDLKGSVDMSYLFSRIQHQNGIVLEDSARKQLENETASFEFVHTDVVMLKPRVKHLGLMYSAQAKALLLRAQLTKGNQNAKKRLLEMARQKYEAVASAQTSLEMIRERDYEFWGDILVEQTRDTNFIEESTKYLESAAEKYLIVLEMSEEKDLSQVWWKWVQCKASMTGYLQTKNKVLEAEHTLQTVVEKYILFKERITSSWVNELNFRLYYLYESSKQHPGAFFIMNSMALQRYFL